MPIKQIVIHHIDKKPDGNPAVILFADHELPAESQTTETLMADLNDAYNAKQGKAWGLFHPESGAHPFSGWLSKYLKQETTFLEFSNVSIEHLTKLMFWHLENVKYLCYAIQTFRSSGASKAA